MANALVSKESVNVIIVDWRGGSLPMYSQAAANTRLKTRTTIVVSNGRYTFYQIPFIQYLFIKYPLSNTIYQIPFIKYLLSNTI